MYGTYKTVVDLVRQAFNFLLLALLEPLKPEERVALLMKHATEACSYQSKKPIEQSNREALDARAKLCVDLLFSAVRDVYLYPLTIQYRDGSIDINDEKRNEAYEAERRMNSHQARLAATLVKVLPSVQPGIRRDRYDTDGTPSLEPDYAHSTHLATRELLYATIVKQWATTSDEAEADELFRGLQMINLCRKEYAELLTKCLRDGGKACPLARLTRHLREATAGITERFIGGYGNEEAPSFARSLANLWVRAIQLRDLKHLALLAAVIGEGEDHDGGLAQAAWSSILDRTSEIARLKKVVESLFGRGYSGLGLDFVFSGGKVENLDVTNQRITLLMQKQRPAHREVTPADAEEQARYELVKWSFASWVNSHPEVKVTLIVRICQGGKVLREDHQEIVGKTVPATA